MVQVTDGKEKLSLDMDGLEHLNPKGLGAKMAMASRMLDALASQETASRQRATEYKNRCLILRSELEETEFALSELDSRDTGAKDLQTKMRGMNKELAEARAVENTAESELKNIKVIRQTVLSHYQAIKTVMNSLRLTP